MLSLESTMMPPVGKSGPLTHFRSDFDFASGLSIRCSAASQSSAVLCAGIEIEQPHAVEDAPVHRLQPVAGVRQCAMHEGRERVSEIALFQRIAQRNVMNFSRLFRR